MTVDQAVRLVIALHTHYWVRHYRRGALIGEDRFENLVTLAGRTALLDLAFRTGVGANAWYLGLVDAAGFTTGYASSDTFASHAGWAESTAYSDATRPQFLPAAASGASLDNTGSPALVTMGSGATLRGGFLGSDSTKGGATGMLYGVGDFTAPRTVLTGDQLLIVATLTD